MKDAAQDSARTLLDPSEPLAARRKAADRLSRQGTASAASALIAAAETADLPPDLARYVGACIARAGISLTEWDLRNWTADAYLGWGEGSSTS